MTISALAISGSPRKNGNTQLLLQRLLERLATHGVGGTFLTLSGKSIRGCTACGRCISSRDRSCSGIVDDDFQPIFEAMQQADIIVVGSPVYFGSATPEVMALLDRAGYVAKANGNLFARKVGGPIAVARRAGHNFTFAQLLMWYMINDMIVPGSSYWNVALAREAGSVNQDAEALGTIDRFADNLAWLAEKISAGTTRGCLKGATLTHSHNSTLQGLGTHHTSVQTTDLDASLRFYRDVMGMVEVAKFEASGRQVYLLDIGDGTHLELFGPSSSVPQPVLQEAPYRHLALYVEDVPQAVAIVRAAGRPIKVEPKQVVLAGRQTTVAFFEGPSGELVEFFHPDFP